MMMTKFQERIAALSMDLPPLNRPTTIFVFLSLPIQIYTRMPSIKNLQTVNLWVVATLATIRLRPKYC